MDLSWFLFSFNGRINRKPYWIFLVLMVVLLAAVEAGLAWLAVAGVIASVIGAFYYLRVVKFMYFDKPYEDAPVEVGGAAQLTLGINGIAMLVLGFFLTIIMAYLHV